MSAALQSIRALVAQMLGTADAAEELYRSGQSPCGLAEATDLREFADALSPLLDALEQEMTALEKDRDHHRVEHYRRRLVARDRYERFGATMPKDLL